MNNSLNDDFTNFMNARLNDAEDRLTLDDSYMNELIKAQDERTHLKDTLNAEQAALLERVFLTENEYLASKRERNAYCAGLADGIQLMATL